jgi:polar amino acid transport system substrate-binding protein
MRRRQVLEFGVGAVAMQMLPAWGAEIRSPLRMVYFESAEPLSWRSTDGGMRGMLVDILEAALRKRAKIELTHEGFPWARAQLMVRQGDADGFCTIPTPERLTYTIASTEPAVSLPFSIYTKADGKRLGELKLVKTIEDLRPFSHVSYIGSGWAKQNLSGMNLRSVPKIEDCLRMVASGDADAFIEGQWSGRQNIIALGLQAQIVELPQTIDHARYHLCIRKESPYVDILPAFDKAIVAMRREGVLDAILAKYLPR